MNIVDRQASSIAILCLTRGGARLACQLALCLPQSHLYLPSRLQGEAGAGLNVTLFDGFKQAFAAAFQSHQALICIMASGIVVRSLNGLMTSKYTDPAVVVVDEKGRYAISLLSGHLGGANLLSVKLAKCLGGQAVITTATDVNGHLAVDMLAQQMDAIITPARNLRIINRCLAEGEVVHLYSPWLLQPEYQQGLLACAWPYEGPLLMEHRSRQLFQGLAVVVSCQEPPADCGDEILFLSPRNLSLGIGCRQGVDYQQLYQAVQHVLQEFSINVRCLVNLASIDIKREEPALQQLAAELKLPFLTFKKEDIAALDGTFASSDWVKQSIGVGGVCEPAARLAAKQGITIVGKQKIGPVTISVAMEKSWWWDWDQAEQNS